MDKDEMIGQYEESLRKAEADIEAALRAVCPLHGPFPRYEIGQALEKVQEAIRGAFRLYNNDEVG